MKYFADPTLRTVALHHWVFLGEFSYPRGECSYPRGECSEVSFLRSWGEFTHPPGWLFLPPRWVFLFQLRWVCLEVSLLVFPCNIRGSVVSTLYLKSERLCTCESWQSKQKEIRENPGATGTMTVMEWQSCFRARFDPAIFPKCYPRMVANSKLGWVKR